MRKRTLTGGWRVLFALAISTFILNAAHADLFVRNKAYRRFGNDKHVVIAIDGRNKYGLRFYIGVPDVTAGQDRQGWIPRDCAVDIDVEAGKIPQAQKGRSIEKDGLFLVVRKLFDDRRTELDAQTRKTEDRLKKHLERQKVPKEIIRKELFSGILTGRLEPNQFQPGDVMRIVVDSEQHQDPIHIDLVVAPYTLDEMLALQASAAGFLMGQVIIPQGVTTGTWDPNSLVPQGNGTIPPPNGNGIPPYPNGGNGFPPQGGQPGYPGAVPSGPPAVNDRDAGFRRNGPYGNGGDPTNGSQFRPGPQPRQDNTPPPQGGGFPGTYPPPGGNGHSPGYPGYPYGYPPGYGYPPYPQGYPPYGTGYQQPPPGFAAPPPGQPGVPARPPVTPPPPPPAGQPAMGSGGAPRDINLGEEQEYERRQRMGASGCGVPAEEPENAPPPPQGPLFRLIFQGVPPSAARFNLEARGYRGTTLVSKTTVSVVNGTADVPAMAGVSYTFYLPREVEPLFGFPDIVPDGTVPVPYLGRSLDVPVWDAGNRVLTFRRK